MRNTDTEFGLTCTSKLNALPDLLFYLGFVLSCFFGSCIDRFNRKWSWFTTQLLGSCIIGFQLLSKDVYSYSLLRLAQGCLNLLFYNSYYVYVTEIIEPQRRSVLIPFVDMMSGIGTCMLSLVAYLVTSWRGYTGTLAIVSLISSLSVVLMPESSLWLESRQINHGKNICRRFASSRHLLWTSFKLSVLFSSSMMSFYGLSLSIGSVSGNIYINFFILGVADAFASLVLVFMTKFITRIRLLMVHFFGVGLSCIIVGLLRFYQIEQGNLPLVFFMLGKFFASCTSSLVFLATAESFPTECRTFGVGVCQFVARVMNVVLVVVLQGSSDRIWLPPLIFGVLATLAGVICRFLPNNSSLELRTSIVDTVDSTIH